MRAVVYERYGTPDVLAVREVPKPTVGARDVLVRVHAAAVGAGDWHLLTAGYFAVRLYQGLRRPKRPVLGHEAAGTVEAVGADVERFAVGDAVYGESPDAGTFAESVRIPERTLAPKPPSLSFEEAAAVPVSALTALQGLRDKGKIAAGQAVLINGASGGVGTYGVQLAKAYGAHVTATCSAPKVDRVRALGADAVLDYAVEDFTRHKARYDLVLDVVGNRSVRACKATLRPGGIYVAVGGPPLRALRIALAGGKRAVTFIAKPGRADLEALTERIEAGAVRPVVDRTFPLEAVPDAMRYFGSHQACGKVVIAL